MLAASGSSGSLFGTRRPGSGGPSWLAPGGLGGLGAPAWGPASAPPSGSGNRATRVASPAGLAGSCSGGSARLGGSPAGMAGLARKGSAPTLGSAARGLGLGAAGSWALQQPMGGCLGALAERARLQAERCARATITIEAEFDIACWVSLESGQVDGADLPLVVNAGSSCSVCYVSDGEGIVGSIVLEGFREGIPFQVRPGGNHLLGESFVLERGKHRATVTARVAGPPEAPLNANFTVPSLPRAVGAQGAAGAAAELRMTEGCPATLTVDIRRVQEAEVRRLEARREASST